jgi:predicted ABC-type ATPase
MDGFLKIVIIAGPNGAGKTTFARSFLPEEAECRDFINADLIAAGLSPFDPSLVAIRSGRLMIEEIKSRVRQRRSFAFETTLSGLTYARLIRQWQRAGYRVKIVFLSLPSPELAVARVRTRVAQGGHDVPESVVRRRFKAGLRNFHNRYKKLADSWVLYENSGDRPTMIEAGFEQ